MTVPTPFGATVADVPTFEDVTREHVLLTLQEYDGLGATRFLEGYRFAAAPEYVLWHEGRSYDSKAVLGVAQRFVTGAAASSSSFSGGHDGAAKVLRNLDFEVSGTDTDGHWQDVSDVGQEESRVAWSAAARDVLLGVAGRYGSVVTTKDLAVEVQRLTGIRSTQLAHYWIGDVLARVAAECDRRGEPLLPALCVNGSGSVGEAYAVAVRAGGGEAPDAPDTHAAVERLACHRYFEAADLPADGGHPALTATLQRSRDRERRLRQADVPIATCSRCNMAIPNTGLCDNCD